MKKYQKVPPQTITMKSWETVCIDLLALHNDTDKSGTDRILTDIVFVDLPTG